MTQSRNMAHIAIPFGILMVVVVMVVVVSVVVVVVEIMVMSMVRVGGITWRPSTRTTCRSRAAE